MSLRDLNESSRPLNNDPAGNSAGLNSFHTINPEERAPSHTPQIVGAVAVALMVGAAAIGLYAYSGPSHPKPVIATNANPATPPAPEPAAAPPAPQQAANMPADATTPPAKAAANDSTPDAAPVKEASTKPARNHHRVASSASGDSATTASSQNASNGASVRMSADSTQTSQAPAQQNAVQAQSQQATPLPSVPQPSPSDVAANNAQPSPAEPAAPQPATPAPQNETAPAPAQ